MLGIKVDLNGTPGSMVWNMITVSRDADMDVQEGVSQIVISTCNCSDASNNKELDADAADDQDFLSTNQLG